MRITWENLGRLKTRHIAVFWTHCKSELQSSRWEMTSTWTRSCDAFVTNDWILQMLLRGNLQDQATAGMLGMQDGLLSRIKPRFLAVDEGDTVTSLTVTDRSIQGQSFPGMERSSVL